MGNGFHQTRENNVLYAKLTCLAFETTVIETHTHTIVRTVHAIYSLVIRVFSRTI